MRFLHDPNHNRTLREARFGLCCAGLLTVSLLAGCGGGGSNGNSGGGTTTGTTGTSTTGTTGTGGTTGTSTGGTGTGGQTQLTVTGTTATGLTASLTEASSTVGVGGNLVYTLTLTNPTTTAIPVHATAIPVTTPAAGLIVTGPSGMISFEPIPGAAPVYNGTLAAGQSISLTQTANGFTTAGTYSAVATFSDDTTAAKSVGPLTVTAQ